MLRYYSEPMDGARCAIVGVQTKINTLKLAVSRCSKKDQFDRKKGRMIAEGRLAKGICKEVPIPAQSDVGSFFYKQATKLAEEVQNEPELVHQS